ncbi:RNA polymerase II transcription factor B subunit 4 [Ascosphaera aggregata]|nr:RNA polymerase II transcription factor B subunit 4 [Ascosphaera aggregata]
MAGALTLALSHINRETIAFAEANGAGRPDDPETAGKTLSSDIAAAAAAANDNGKGGKGSSTTQAANTSTGSTGLRSRILVVSVSPTTDAAHQYIPLMNTIFACQRLRIPVDIAVLAGHPVFLQQAADATGGVYMPITPLTGFLEYLLLAYLPDARLRRKTLWTPSQVDIDFRAACFCHRKVIDVGPAARDAATTALPQTTSVCLTCGTVLSLEAEYGVKPAVLPRRKKKRKIATTAGGGSASAVTSRGASATPTPKKEGA